MDVQVAAGKYVVAVSGGVDSTVLLNLLNKQLQKSKELELIIAHFDHGIRPDSIKDRQLVEDLAAKYGLEFYFEVGKLAPNASEDTARQARYEFLNRIVKSNKADNLITAHHQDDLIETAIINIIRGTGRKGLSSLRSDKIIRPLLKYPKTDVINYAKKNKLIWREDVTNQDTKYLRNYIRHKIVPKLDSKSRKSLIKLINKQAELNLEIDKQLTDVLNKQASGNKLPRLWLNSLDNSLSRELLAAWLRQNDLSSFDRQAIERLASKLKTLSSGKSIEVYKGWQVITAKEDLALEHVER